MCKKESGIGFSSQESACASSKWFRGDRGGTAPLTCRLRSTLSCIAQTPALAVKECMVKS